jgi:hypothetical protein
MFSGLFTFDVDNADEELQLELYDIQCDSVLKGFVRLVYQIFTLSSPGIDSEQLLNLGTKHVQCLAAKRCATIVFAYENAQTHESSGLTYTYLSSIMKVILA